MSSRSALMGGGGYALKLPVIDISEVGAGGGGSIAWLDKAGSLKVGPESAGRGAGDPACYDTGNEEPTVTDANVVLGFLNPEALAGGSVPIRSERAHGAIASRLAEPLGRGIVETAFGVHTVANANMMKAVKAVTTYRGRDPRDFTLVCIRRERRSPCSGPRAGAPGRTGGAPGGGRGGSARSGSSSPTSR